jgi:hypothetical protein
MRAPPSLEEKLHNSSPGIDAKQDKHHQEHFADHQYMYFVVHRFSRSRQNVRAYILIRMCNIVSPFAYVTRSCSDSIETIAVPHLRHSRTVGLDTYPGEEVVAPSR